MVGRDLTRICLPVYFNEPLSALQARMGSVAGREVGYKGGGGAGDQLPAHLSQQRMDGAGEKMAG
jgi:hypothetical protein